MRADTERNNRLAYDLNCPDDEKSARTCRERLDLALDSHFVRRVVVGHPTGRPHQLQLGALTRQPHGRQLGEPSSRGRGRRDDGAAGIL